MGSKKLGRMEKGREEAAVGMGGGRTSQMKLYPFPNYFLISI